MSPNNYKSRKQFKKQRRCIAIVENECKVQSSESATPFLAVLNAGLSTGLTEERVLAAAGPHGELRQLVMVHGKSYCFLECASNGDAHRIFCAMHNSAKIGQNDAVVYLGFFDQLPEKSENLWAKHLPPGLLLLPDFVSPDEEAALLQAIGVDVAIGDVDKVADALKHRHVKHYGFEFLYDINNVDASQPLEQDIPDACDYLWPRLQLAAAEYGLAFEWQTPDQLTVNEYLPGQGIPPHVDTHSAFLEPILSLSLQGSVVMDFRKGNERVPVILPQRSLLVMVGEARFDWTHGITPRITDVVPTARGALTTQPRKKRTSLTFRRLRRGPCKCNFPALCDTRLQELPSIMPGLALTDVAVQLEELNVHSVYEEIANHFSETRHTPWPQVVAFLDSFPAGSVLIDVGCGNGKYLECNRSILMIGCDRSLGLLGTCVANKKLSVFRCDCLQVPIRSASVDGCISIAVIHHLATAERRLAAVREMARLLRPGGRALIYVWAKDQCSDAKKSSYLRQNKAVNKQRTTEQHQRQQQQQQVEQLQKERIVDLPIHTNRTDFQQQDVLVPWKLKATKTLQSPVQSTFLRYYHVFAEHELKELIALVPEVVLLRSYYDQGNCCVIFERK